MPIGIGVDSARADGWNDGAVDEIVDDGAAAAVEAFDGSEAATETALGVAPDPLHAVVTNAAATIAIARRRRGPIATRAIRCARSIVIPSGAGRRPPRSRGMLYKA